jgi:hypothetical protein
MEYEEEDLDAIISTKLTNGDGTESTVVEPKLVKIKPPRPEGEELTAPSLHLFFFPKSEASSFYFFLLKGLFTLLQVVSPCRREALKS